MKASSELELMARLGWSDTLFGMTVLAFLVTVEELARELPAALKKRPDITYGNVLGSILSRPTSPSSTTATSADPMHAISDENAPTRLHGVLGCSTQSRSASAR